MRPGVQPALAPPSEAGWGRSAPRERDAPEPGSWAAAGRAPTALGAGRAALAPARLPSAVRRRLARAGCGDAPVAGPSPTRRGRHRRGDKGARPHVRAWTGGAEALGTRGGHSAEGLGVRGRSGRGVTCAVVVAPGEWPVGTARSAPWRARAHL